MIFTVKNYKSLPETGSHRDCIFFTIDPDDCGKSGYYISDGKEWHFLGAKGEVEIVQVGNDLIVGKPIEFCSGQNVKITGDKHAGKVIFSAPLTNVTSIKVSPFVLSGQCVEFIAGKNIVISSINPDKVIIGVDITKELELILDLKKRIENIETIIRKLFIKKTDGN